MNTLHATRNSWIRPASDGTYEVVTVGIHVDGLGFETSTAGLTIGEAEDTLARLLEAVETSRAAQ